MSADNEAGNSLKNVYVLSLTRQLAHIASLLRSLGIFTLFVTLFNIAALVGGVVNSVLIRQYNQINSQEIANGASREYFSYYWLIANLVIFTMSLIILGISDFLRRRGDALFQEVSNTFQAFEKDQSVSSQGARDELMTAARISLRSFASSADPPLIRGRYGAGIYALVNIVIVLIAVILYSQAA